MFCLNPRSGADFHCTFFYGSTDKREWLVLFQQLHDISKSICNPWIVTGDFNNVANLNECHDISIKLHENTAYEELYGQL